MAASLDADLVIIGGGPAGCAAAVMAASLGLSTIVVDPQALCHKLETAPSLVNVLGGFTTGADLATTIRQDVRRTPHCAIQIGRRATQVRAADDHIEIRLDDGDSLTAPFTVVATGVGPLRLADAVWIDTDLDDPPPLWQATRSDLTAQDVIVLGVDRPLGTLLRSMPDVATRLIVTYAPDEAYKASEVGHDPRVMLLPTRHASLHTTADGTVNLRTASRDGHHTHSATRVYSNLGSRPSAPDGDLVTGPDGYCPPDRQHPRVLIAGDLRSARYQRIMTAFGTGAEAALTAYYQLADIH